MNGKSSLLRASALAVLLSCTWLQAAVVETVFHNNTPEPPILRVEVNSADWWAQSFIVTTECTLSSVMLRMEMGVANSSPGHFLVQLYEANLADNTPGDSIGGLFGSTNPFAEDTSRLFPIPVLQ